MFIGKEDLEWQLAWLQCSCTVQNLFQVCIVGISGETSDK